RCRRSRLTSQNPIDRRPQFRELERLLDDLAGRVAGEVGGLLRHEVACREHEPTQHFGILLLDSIVQLDPGKARHPKIGYDQRVGWNDALRAILNDHLESTVAVA